MRQTLFLIFLLGICNSLLFAQNNVKALVGGTLIDGYGNEPLDNSVIIIEGERITDIGQVGQIDIPDNAEIISTEGMSVLPGLWDMHVHLMLNGHSDYGHWHPTYMPIQQEVIMPASAHQLLMAGVTSARDLGAPLREILGVRDAINAGEIPGPTMYVSGPFLQHEPYPGTDYYRWGINGVEDARAKVRKLANAGVDCIKLIDQDQMAMDEVYAVVDEAHKHNLTVVAHAHRPEEIRRGLLAGVDCFEHTGLASSPEYPADVIEMIKERTAQMNKGPLFWTPTVEVLYNYDYIRGNPELLDQKSWHLGLPDSIIQDIKESIARPGELPYYQLTPIRIPTLERKFNQIKETGAVMLIGTDSGVPLEFHSQSTWKEFDVWVNEFGYDPLLAIKAGTYWPSVLMGVDDEVGTVSVGKYADIIAVKGDVLRYIDLLQDVDMVIKHGKRYK
jgi:imidazolonepropionase-like amidohydrolase